jgi:hypothetical protein
MFPSMTVNYLDVDDTEKALKGKPKNYWGRPEQTELLRTLLVRMVSSENSKIPSPVAIEIGSCGNSSWLFHEYWLKSQGSKYVKKE